LLQDESTSKYATLPAGHPLGYHDAVLNLFKDFYAVIKRGKQTSSLQRPTFKTGYEEMRILDAIVESNRRKRWVKVV
jgi:predicted dehydrogenase